MSTQDRENGPSLMGQVQLGRVFLAVGVVVMAALLVAAALSFASVRRDLQGPSVTGTVIDAESTTTYRGTGNERRGRVTYYPVVRYTVNGQDYEVTARSGGNRRPREGTPRTVYYRADRPANGHVRTGWPWFVPTLLGGLVVLPGGLFALIGALVLRDARSRAEASRPGAAPW